MTIILILSVLIILFSVPVMYWIGRYPEPFVEPRHFCDHISNLFWSFVAGVGFLLVCGLVNYYIK